MKKNNKGFSLVELIVVVLIMAIIAVALAPQVMKWVENSRKSTDCSNYDTLYEACGVALTDTTIYAKVKASGTAGIKLECTDTLRNWAITASDTATFAIGSGAFYTNIKGQLGDKWESNLKAKASVLDNITPQGAQASGQYTITINSDGTVTRTYAPDDSKIS